MHTHWITEGKMKLTIEAFKPDDSRKPIEILLNHRGNSRKITFGVQTFQIS